MPIDRPTATSPTRDLIKFWDYLRFTTLRLSKILRLSLTPDSETSSNFEIVSDYRLRDLAKNWDCLRLPSQRLSEKLRSFLTPNTLFRSSHIQKVLGIQGQTLPSSSYPSQHVHCVCYLFSVRCIFKSVKSPSATSVLRCLNHGNWLALPIGTDPWSVRCQINYRGRKW